MCKKLLFISLILGLVTLGQAQIITFAGGTAYTPGGAVIGTPTDTMAGYFSGVGYYIENGVKVEFLDSSGNYVSAGIVGRYYPDATGGRHGSVMHAHPWNPSTSQGLAEIRVSKISQTGSPLTFDLNYLDLTSNTDTGGGAASGNEVAFVTPYMGAVAGTSYQLSPSDWGIDVLSNGVTPGDGVIRNWFGTAFDNIDRFSVTAALGINSRFPYCFGMDNFYIDVDPPIPEPTTVGFLAIGAIGGFLVWRRRHQKAV